MRGSVIGLGGALVGFAWACGPGAFACTENGDCTRASDGVCESQNACSYPDDACDSGRRFSVLGAFRPGQCVDIGGDDAVASDTTTDGIGKDTDAGADETGRGPSEDTGGVDSVGETTGPSEETGEPPQGCDAVDCSGHGSCVMVDAEPSCACEAGWTMVGADCLEDPCESTTCFFVDDLTGDDQADGSRDNPWQSVARVQQALPDAVPGDHFLFRRGGTFSGPQRLTVDGVTGLPQDPIVFGAYGAPDDPRPRLLMTSIELDQSTDIVVRDFEVRNGGTNHGPCVFVERSHRIVVQDLELSECNIRGVRFSRDTSHTTLFRNTLHDIGNKSAIFISDITWPEDPNDHTFIGSHHWIADNVINGDGEVGIHVDASVGDGDIKVVGNQVANTDEDGIRTFGDYAWALNNTVVNAGRDDNVWMDALDVAGSYAQVRGNILAASRRPLRLRMRGTASANTLMHSGVDEALDLTSSGESLEVLDNLIFNPVSDMIEIEQPLPDVWLSSVDGNVYAHEGDGCTIFVDGTTHDLDGWRMLTGFDDSGRCAVVDGLSNVTLPADAPFTSSVFDAAMPTALAECETVGALDCDGEPRPVHFDAFVTLADGEGRGWEGPLLIQQRYPLQ